MKKRLTITQFLPIYLTVFGVCILIAAFSSRAVTTIAQSTPLENRVCIVIDAGHGGEDGGAVSCTGAYESTINLQISQRLNDLLLFLGYRTHMIRTQDVSMHTTGNSIAAHKVSDLKNRVHIINQVPYALMISIHQNSFSEGKYYGAQVFHADDAIGKELALTLQNALIRTINSGSNRSAKKASGVYLMEHIQCPGVLIECGFLSNPEEEAKLRAGEYQRKLSCVIAATVAQFLSTQKLQ